MAGGNLVVFYSKWYNVVIMQSWK